MKPSILLAALFAFAAAAGPALAGTCVGPAPCGPEWGPGDSNPAEPTSGPPQLCLNDALGCVPITYLKQVIPGTSAGPALAGYFALAFSSVGGYPVMGWAGPCLPGWACPAIFDAAYQDLWSVALKAQRNIRYATD